MPRPFSFTTSWAAIVGCLAFFLAGCGSVDVATDRMVYDEEVASIGIFLEDRDADLLYSRDPMSRTRLNAFARYNEGRARALRGVRFRGNTTRFHPKKSFNIRFEQSQPFLYDSARMNLNAMYTDPSGMRERLAWGMFADLEQPASRTRYFQFYLNGTYEGLGLHVQRVDETLLAQHGLSTRGTMVRDMTRRRGADAGLDRGSIFGHDLRQTADATELLSAMFNSRWPSDWDALADLVQWVHDTEPGDAFAEGFAERVDVENFTDWLAVHYLIGDVDAFGDDYWLYRGTRSADRWKVIPWDHDLSFGRNEREGLAQRPGLGQMGAGLSQLNDYFAYEYPIDDAGWDNALVSNFLSTDALRDGLYARLDEFMADVFTETYFEDRISQIRPTIEPFMNRSPSDGGFERHLQQHHGEFGRFSYHVENLQDFVALRYAYLDRAINPIEGTAYEAEASLQGAGERVALTDAEGWTLAWFTPSEPSNATIRISSAPAEDHDVQQVWTIDTGGEEIEGHLTLFYRNDVAPDGKDNWYRTDDAVGDQWNLHLARLDENGAGDLAAEGQVNPYTNKVEGRVQLTDGSRWVVVEP